MGTAYPGPKIHHPSRRKMGRGQPTNATGVMVTISASADTVTLAFDRPVSVTGVIPLAVTGLSFLSQTIVDAQTVTQTFSGPLAGLTYTLSSVNTNALTPQGGTLTGSSGTFPAPPVNPDDIIVSAGGNYYPPPDSEVAAGYQFGVGGTSDTGTYVTPPATLNSIVSAVYNGGNSYTVTFDAPITVVNPSVEEPAIIAYNPTTNLWTELETDNPAGGNSNYFIDANLLGPFTLVVLISQPTTFIDAAANNFALGNPTAIT